MSDLTVPAWFDDSVYFQNKLADLGEGWTEDALNSAFSGARYSLDATGMYRHFLEYGNSENVSPSPLFDVEDYLRNKASQSFDTDTPTEAQIAQAASDIAGAGMSAWDHYCNFGWLEGLNPSANFDADRYFSDKLAQLIKSAPREDGKDWTQELMVDAFKDAGLNPVTHYFLFGKSEGLTPHPVIIEPVITVPDWFDADVYFENKLAMMGEGGTEELLNSAFTEAGYSLDATGMYRHFLEYGNSENVSPSPLFDVEDYLKNKASQSFETDTPTEAQIAQVASEISDAGMSAWDHYCNFGWLEGLNPSDNFDADQYLSDKVAQLTESAPREDGEPWTEELVIDTFKEAGVNPLTHYELYGDSEGLVPTPVTGIYADPAEGADLSRVAIKGRSLSANPGKVSVDTSGKVLLDGAADPSTASLSPGSTLDASAVTGPGALTLDTSAGSGYATSVSGSQHTDNSVTLGANTQVYIGGKLSDTLTLESGAYSMVLQDETGENVLNLAATASLTLKAQSNFQGTVLGGGEGTITVEKNATVMSITSGGNDTIIVNGSVDTITGGGNGTITVNGSAGTINGGQDNDTIVVASNAVISGYISGGLGADKIQLNNAAQTIQIAKGDTGAYTVGAIFHTIQCDVITGLGSGTRLVLDGGWTATDTLNVVSALAAVGDNTASVFRGVYSANTFSANAAGNDRLLVYDADADAGGMALQAVVLVGVSDALTAEMTTDGSITFS